jgi:hypothetical protein
MCLKKTIFMASMLILSSCFAMPPYKVLQSCREQKPFTDKITYKELDGGHFTNANDIDPSCDDKIYNIGETEDEYFQYRSCKKDYLVIHGNDVDLTKATNLSVTGVVYPHYLIPHVSSWSKITYENQAYLCIESPLSQVGYGAANLQYYIAEHAFDQDAPSVLYFYFFNKDIHSWIASHEKRD